MAFQTKTFLAIVSSMISRARTITQRITDYNVGSVARTLMEAPAQEIDQLYMELLFGLQEAIPTSVYTSFNFPALAATPASNLIRVTIAVQASAVVIPAGTLFTLADGSQSYASTADAVILAGASFGDVPVAAVVAGVAGNIPANGSFTPALSVPGFVSAINLSPFANGSDAETASARKVRFNAYIQTLSRGTVAALLYALTRLTVLTDTLGNVTEAVVSANIDEPYLSDPAIPPGLVNAYIHNGVGGTSQALVQQAAAVLNGYVRTDGTKVAGYKAAGVVVQTYAASEIPVAVNGMLTIAPTYNPTTVVAAVTSAVFTYIQQISVGKPYLASVCNEIVMQIPGVLDWEVTTPPPYIQVSFSSKLMPGAFLIVGWLTAHTVLTVGTSGSLTS
jgi:uncharacterized phage protein gp47/JayE